MKRLPTCFIIAWMICSFPGAIRVHAQAKIFVAVNGADNNEGTISSPLGSIQTALRKARDLRRSTAFPLTIDIHIVLQPGIYYLDAPVMIRTQDSGVPGSETIIEGDGHGEVILSGGRKISGWKKVTTPINGLPAVARNKVWYADVPASISTIRQLWVGEKKAVRAKSSAGDSMHRIFGWNKQSQSCTVPSSVLKGNTNVNGMEMFIHQWWAIAMLRIREIKVKHDTATLFFEQPESRIQSEHPWPAPWISNETGNSAFFLSNAISFLDEPGEWYFDKTINRVYYWPRQGERISETGAIAPVLENLLTIGGTIDENVSHLKVRNIFFKHTTWLRPGLEGHVPHQAGMYMTEAYRLKPPGTKERPQLDNQAWIGRPAAALYVSYANHISIEHCSFEQLASAAVDFHRAVRINTVEGNLFRDIGGTAILGGVFSEPGQEIHTLYKPSDMRVVCDSLTIRNNVISDAANEDWSCPGIGLGYTRNSIVANNDVGNVANTGISMGWGWNPAVNVMENNRVVQNRIHHFGKHNYDCGGIYTLSAQPGSLISENTIDSVYKAPYAHLPSHWFYIYTDEGSAGITVRDNYCPSEKFLQNANGPGNTWINNGPMVNPLVKINAGPAPAYRNLLSKKTIAKGVINKEHFEMIELVTDIGKNTDRSKLAAILRESDVDTNSVYQWKNHTVIFAKVKDVSVLQGRLVNRLPGTKVKVYYDLFYEFNRSYCSDTTTAREWEHVLLTTNLVDNPRMQQEYLDHHTTQFEKWPELSRGFCNASFQQLLIYRNGRQLILVISIPKGESLDRLNPKTTENNPRVIEWNKMMSKYQEGIEGTKKGEVWVRLE